MSTSVDLVCVDPKQIKEFWPHASHLIRRSAEKTGLNSFADIERGVFNGTQLLWLAWNGTAIEAVATTELIRTNYLACVITACAGEKMQRWIPLIHQIENYAKAEGCSRVHIYGRKGWSRMLEDYEMKYVILERMV